ncbi:MAG: hypothetical protein FWH32_06290 [Clostridiales bacterium]|nr:hypothetical protein [Clostridiales bacterium]
MKRLQLNKVISILLLSAMMAMFVPLSGMALMDAGEGIGSDAGGETEHGGGAEHGNESDARPDAHDCLDGDGEAPECDLEHGEEADIEAGIEADVTDETLTDGDGILEPPMVQAFAGDSEESDEELAPLADHPWSGSTPPTVAGGDTVTLGGSPSGTLDIPIGATVTMNGVAAETTAGLTLNIGAGATVIWDAILAGSSSAYLVSLTGSGTFEMRESKIANMGTPGGGISIGGNVAVNIGSGASVFSDVRGNPIRVNAGGVTITIGPGGLVESLGANSADPNAAIQVNNNLPNVTINVNGGSVVSTNEGYAINDGAGTAEVGNTTVINVRSGVVSADRACAIHSTGSGSVANISGGSVSNAAANNLNPAINMNAGSGSGIDNINISGGTVQSRTAAGWAVQTKGNVVVSGGLVTAVNGRAINLAGMTSKATVTDGRVEATGNGTAISTSTTALGEVVNTSVVVSGGAVCSEAGLAINVTGANSIVEVSGGSVSTEATMSTAAAQRHAINASGANSSVTVSGGEVTATFGRAINAAAGVTVGDGFVFAYGTGMADVVQGSPFAGPSLPAIVVAWNQAAGRRTYLSMPINHQDLVFMPEELSLSDFSCFWYNDPATDSAGIRYIVTAPTSNVGFFPIDIVTIISDYGLIFDASDGRMYMNNTGSGVPGGENGEFTAGRGSVWDGAPAILTLNGFFWATAAPIALTIINGNTEIVATPGTFNGFSVIGSQASGNSVGMSAPGLDITIGGGGNMSVSAGEAAGSSFGIDCDGLIFGGGTLTAQGYTRALNADSFGDTTDAYRYWWDTGYNDPGGTGTVYAADAPPPLNTPYSQDPSHRYVKFTTVPFAVVDDVSVTGLTGTPLITVPQPQRARLTISGDSVSAGGLSGVDAGSWFAYLPAGVTVTASASPGGTHVIELTFTGTPLEASVSVFDIVIPGSALAGGGSLAVFFNPDAGFNITAIYDLLVTAGDGGAIADISTSTGKYRAATAISVSANADAGYRFTQWTASGVELGSGAARTATVAFPMPAERVVLTANFARITPPGGGGGGGGGHHIVSGADAALPRTGDDRNMQGWVMALLASVMGLVFVGIFVAWKKRFDINQGF